MNIGGERKMYKVKEVADIVGVSVRTLHHYDQIGLLQPESITPAGYRLYTSSNLERLQQILFFKEIGFSLQEIKNVLDQPDFDRKEALKLHKDLLKKKRQRLDDMIHTVDQTIQSLEGGTAMTNEDMFKGFDMKEIEEHQKKYADEVREKYPKETVDQAQAKTSQYTKDDWQNIMEETNEIYGNIAKRMDRDPADPEVQQEVGKWKQFITENFYYCTFEIFRGLADLYVDDPRFTKNIDKHGEGLSQYLRKAMIIYCDNHS